tara:strand:- start:5847 stop:7745 length:1899 start_codon:yes stop_codon:yes gene_type:complete
MRLDKVILENFLTYESLEYNIPRTPLLVQGLNKTEEDQESNGSGKSGMFTAIEFCIASSNSRGVSDKELVMFGQKEARVQLYASCDVRKESIHIDWTIKIKGSNKLTLKIEQNGKWNEVSFSNVNDGKKAILDWFAIEKEDLFNYYIINKSRFKSFFRASNKEKVDLINRFSDASIIDGLDKLDNTELELEAGIIKANIDKAEGKIELLQDQIQDESERDVKADAKQAIEDLQDDILDVKEEIKEFKQKRFDDETIVDNSKRLLQGVNSKISTAQLAIDNVRTIDYSTDTLYNEREDLVSKDLKVSKLLNELSIELSGTIECPKCEHEFILDSSHGTVEEAQAKNKKAQAIQTSILDKIDLLDSSILELETKDAEQNEVKNTLRENLMTLKQESLTSDRTVLKYEAIVAEHDKDIIDCKNDITKMELQIKELKSVDGSNNVSSLQKDLKGLKIARTALEGDLNKKNDEIYERNKWKNNFKQFRMHLANQSLEAIEYHMNRYLVEMGSDLKVIMEGFKMLSNGTFKDEITAKILRNVERTFASFSGGEQGRLLFAAILANRHMLNSTHKYGGLDFLSVDEVFEGVDSLGLKSLIKSAKLLDIAVMVITHVTDEEVNDDILLIEKVNGISYVKS